MNSSHPLRKAIEIIGLTALARELRVSHQAVRKWEAAGRMPRTEWTGETQYGAAIERLTGGAVTHDQLLQPWPQTVETRDAA